MMKLEEIASKLRETWEETRTPREWQAMAKRVQAWLDAPRELRMVPGPPPVGASGEYLFQASGVISLTNFPWHHGRDSIEAHLGPILPYEPPKPLTKPEAWEIIHEWVLSSARRGIRRSLVGSDGIWLLGVTCSDGPDKSFDSIIAAAEWIRQGGGV